LAVAAATADDTVLVSNGTHMLTAQVTIDNITVQGFSGDYNDVIAQANGGTFTCFKLVNSNSMLSGLTITNAIGATVGGAVNFTPAGAGVLPAGTVSNCLITGSFAQRGAAIYCYCSNALVANCVIENNTSWQYGNIYTEGGSGPEIRNSIIRNNIAVSNSYGGGLHVSARNCVVSDTIISGNTATADGGGIYSRQNVLLIRCVISNNVAAGLGGGANFLNDSYPVLSNCIVVGNSGMYGGGVYFKAIGKLYNCLIINNTSAGYGGGVVCEDYTNEFYNCTIANNTDNGNNAGGIYGKAGGIGMLYNTIVYSNIASVAPNYNAVSHVFTNCCTYPMPAGGLNNITNYPVFMNPTSDFRLAIGSPCINTGLNQEWMTGTLDLDGRRRLDRFSGIVDRGCYEYLPKGCLFIVR